MNITCQTCGAMHPTQNDLLICKSFHNTSCNAYEKTAASCSLNGNFLLQHCKSCSEKCRNEVLIMEDSSPYTTPLLTPMSSFGSFFSSYGDFQADMNLQIRDFTNGVLDVDRSNQNQGLDHAEEIYNNALRDINIEPSLAVANYDGFRVDLLAKNKLSSTKNDEDMNVGKSVLNDSMLSDVRLKGTSDDSEDAENVNGITNISLLPNVEEDPLIWVPPEPEVIYDDIDSVANNDDDDICDDGSKWGQPSSLSSLSGDGYQEERRKAMLEAMNGQFKILVSRFLASEGISVSQQDGDENWLDVVVSLSWEAAELVKPDASEGRAMDVGSYVKVKCVASGSCNQSQVIRGLVFKKNAAHKHMPTTFKNPKLLLLQGILGQSTDSLSSFRSMEQEKDDRLKSVVEMIDACHPNVVLVEKTVPRDIQETLVSKGITLVFDMKLHRLERVARCTASPIISFADITGKPKLKQCESFHIERFTEEHNSSGEVGKRSSKTLMFLEGFPKPLGCTVLLRGAHSDILKKIKRIMQYTVFAAYHLILETSFFADQRVFSSDMDSVKKQSDFKAKSLSSVGIADTDYLNIDILAPSNVLDIPIYSGSLEKNAHEELSNSDIDSEISSRFYNPNVNLGRMNVGTSLQADPIGPSQHQVLQTSGSASSEEVEGDDFLSHISDSVSGFNDFPVSQSFGFESSLSEASSYKGSRNLITSQDKLDDEILDVEEAGPARDSMEAIEQFSADASKRKHTDNIESVLDPQSILVLLSSQCITKQTTCEQSHLSRIKYYGNFDISLGRYLTDILLNQKHSCASCGEPPESHVYSFTHQNGNLTVLIRRLEEKCLSGESEGKIWMWTRCLRCEHEGGIPRTSRRVVLSSSARSLSFGKFLELSFSGHSAVSRLSKCGHSLHRDCLRFFGLGSKVAMFKYSPVEIYAASKPPPVLEFHNPKGQGWIKTEMEDVLVRGHAFFSEISNLLQKKNLMSENGVSVQNHMDFSGLIKDFSQVEEMLKREKMEFEASLSRANDYELPNLKWLEQELLLLLYVWDHRLHWIQQNDHLCQEEDGISSKKYVDSYKSLVGDEILEPLNDDNSLSSSSDVHQPQDVQADLGTKPHKDCSLTSNESCDLDVVLTESLHSSEHFSDVPVAEGVAESLVEQDFKPEVLNSTTGNNENGQGSSIHFSNDIQVEHCVEIAKDAYGTMNIIEPRADDKAYLQNTKYGVHKTELPNGGEKFDASVLNENRNLIEDSGVSGLTDLQRLIWFPFSELKKELRKDLFGGSLQKFEFINAYSPKYLSPMIEPSSHQVGVLHFALGSCGNVLTASEDEISSIIACALAKSEDRLGLLDPVENEIGESNGTLHKSSSLMSDGSMFSSFWSSTGSSEIEGLHSSKSVSSFSSDELSFMSYDGSLPSDHLLVSENLHSDIPLGAGKVAGRCRWSVICIYAKQFYSLRRKCCPSELAYINSLSRCKKWDAQGGKSKAFFAKTMDERFIIKQIKKTELDSFIKFAPDYFKHVSLSLDSGSQTCLAKILGIYQVRKYKSGKEVKIDLMVMENLLYGHTVSRTYDLKGAVFSRYIQDGNGNDKVLLDQNFVEDMRVSPIYVGGKTKHLLQRAIWNDTSFLTSINVMDYSLLVGVDKQKHEIVFGIIDYLRQYTWDKQLETWVKSSIVVPKNELPTVISPKEYKKRFRKFMAKYFLAVPDRWKCEHCSAGCKFCIDDKRNSAKVYNAELSEQPMAACA